jgi:hypothetical protein
MPRVGIFLTGLPCDGDPISKEPERIRKIFKSGKALRHLFEVPDFILKDQGDEVYRHYGPDTPKLPDPKDMPTSFYLHTKTWFDGVTTSTGSGAYFFREDRETDLFLFQESATGKAMKIRGKGYHILAYNAEMCPGCYYPIKDEDTSEESGPYFGLPHRVDRSTVDLEYCQTCKPDWSCSCCGGIAHIPTQDNKDVTEILVRHKFLCCSDCRGDLSEQEKWRNEGHGSSVKDTESSFIEKKHLSDEAIALIQKNMGGKPADPPTDITPFNIVFYIDELLDTTNEYYWPYGMSGLDYLKLLEERKFNNPRSESDGYLGVDVEYDDDWRDIEVNDDLIEEYTSCLGETMEKYPTRLDLPTEVYFEGKTMRLLSSIHGYTCDSGRCQAIFQSGISNPCTVPMYTSREGNLDGDVSELSYGFERCIACLS